MPPKNKKRDIEYDESANEYLLTIAIRVDDHNGNFAGVIKALANTEVLIQESEIANPSAGLTLLTDKGQIIYSTNPFTFLGEYPNTELIKTITGNQQGYSVTSEEGKEKLISYAHSRGFRYFPGLNWTLLVSNDTDVVFEPLTNLKRNLLFASLLVVLVGLITALVVSRLIGKPLRKITEGARMISAGNLDATISVRSHDELGELADAFNKMTQDLKQSQQSLHSYTQQLEQKVAERTKELSSKVIELERMIELMVGRELKMVSLKKEIADRKKKVIK